MNSLTAADAEFLLSRGIARKNWMPFIPDKVKRELKDIYEDYAERIAERLSKFFKADIEGDLMSFDELTYSEFLMSVENLGLTYTFSLPPMEGVGVIDMNHSTFWDLLKLKTGKEIAEEERGSRVKLSKGELKYFRKLAELILRELCAAHKLIEKHSFKLGKFWRGSRARNRQKAANYGDRVLLLSFELTHKEFSWAFAICLPEKMLLHCFITKVPITRRYDRYEDAIEEGCFGCQLLQEFWKKHLEEGGIFEDGGDGEEAGSSEEGDSSEEDKESGDSDAQIELLLDSINIIGGNDEKR
jgi:hypothetical protein